MLESGMPRQAKRTVGRPRRLTLDAIVDAACEVGIAKLEMSLVAERLNTGVATLYGYVRGRDHLLELVAQRLVGQALIKDEGQSWQDILREHATITYRLFRSLPAEYWACWKPGACRRRPPSTPMSRSIKW
jgi:AcrR family transcriptional regulator